MKKKTIMILSIGLAIILVIVVALLYNQKSKNKENLVKADPTSDKIKVEDLKDELGATGNKEIYEVAEEYDGRKILVVKQEVEYKVALAGVLASAKPTFENLDELISNAPTKNGIWINEKSRESFVNIINGLTEGEYYVDNDGYLLTKSGGSNRYDEAIRKLLDGNKQYFIDIKGSNYTVDSMTGEIVENPFERMEPEQTYEYYENEVGDKMVVIFTSNKEKAVTNQEIIESFLELVK